MRVPKKTDYAVRALLEIARHPAATWHQTAQIASRTGIPEKFLEQILLTLKKAGILDSRRGVDGGYALKVELSKLNLDQLIHILEGSSADEMAEASSESKVLCEAMKRADEAARGVLAAVSLEDLAQEVARRQQSSSGLDFTI